MKVYESPNIRNIMLAGHAASGKTTLAETLLFESGTIGRRGSIEERNTVSDYDELEKEKQKSVFSSLMNLDWRGTKINVLDTPGTPDFLGEVMRSIAVADSAVFVLNAEQGVEVGTEFLWKQAEKKNLPSFFVVNKLDLEQSDFQTCVDMTKERFGHEGVVVQYPFSEGGDFHAIIDVLKMTMYEFPEGGGRPDKLPIPESHKSQVELLHNELVEAVAVNDESLMDLYFENGTLDEYQMKEGLQKSLLNRQIFPIFCCCASRNMGTGRIMGFIGNVTPSPLEANPVQDVNGEDLATQREGNPVLFCFKTLSESHVGNLTFFKSCSGSVSQGMDLENKRDGNSQRIGTLSLSQGAKREEVNRVHAGDLAVAVKLKEVHIGDTLTEKGVNTQIAPIEYPEPTMRKALKLQKEGEEDKLGSALHQIQKEDPTVLVEHSQELKQTIIHGQGEEHLAMVLYQLTHRFDLEVEYIAPKIPYRETITKSVRAHYKHKKQSGGAGQFGEVYMLIEPWKEGKPNPDDLSIRDVQEHELPWGGKLIFQNCIVGGVIDNRFMPAILKGVMEKMERGPVSGCRVRDVRISVYDGSMHSVDSNEAAFKTAALLAFKDGFLKAGPQLMEPVYEVEINVPSAYMGDVMSDLNSRRGQIQGMDAEGTLQKVHAHVPLDELDQYATKLKSMTQGSASYTRKFSHYAPVPHDIQNRVVQENLESGAA
ncbi:MAG: elongation factor G [Balneolaceae bacterium]